MRPSMFSTIEMILNTDTREAQKLFKRPQSQTHQNNNSIGVFSNFQSNMKPNDS